MDLREGLGQAEEGGQAVPVLCWHEIAPGFLPSPTRVSPETFSRQLETLQQEGYRSLGLEHWVEGQGRAAPGERTVLLVFDDAYEGVYHHARPLLREAGYQATLFPVLDYIGRKANWDPAPRLRARTHMSEEQIAILLEEGWSLGLHGRSHRPLVGLDLEQLDAELVSARAELELRFDQLVKVISWPYGLSDRRARHLASAAGLRLGLGRFGGEGLFDLPRCMLYDSHGPQELRSLLAGTLPDRRQRWAARGAALSAWVASRRKS